MCSQCKGIRTCMHMHRACSDLCARSTCPYNLIGQEGKKVVKGLLEEIEGESPAEQSGHRRMSALLGRRML